MADQIPSLAEIIKIGSLVDFQEAAVEYLLKSKNLQLFPEDEAFLNATSQGLSPTSPRFLSRTSKFDLLMPSKLLYVGGSKKC
jgi:hypothetical protein